METAVSRCRARRLSTRQISAERTADGPICGLYAPCTVSVSATGERLSGLRGCSAVGSASPPCQGEGRGFESVIRSRVVASDPNGGGLSGEATAQSRAHGFDSRLHLDLLPGAISSSGRALTPGREVHWFNPSIAHQEFLQARTCLTGQKSRASAPTYAPHGSANCVRGKHGLVRFQRDLGHKVSRQDLSSRRGICRC